MKKLALLFMFVCLATGLAAFVNAQNDTKLDIKQVTVWVDGDKDTVSDGGNVNNAKPGSSIKIEVEVENLYTDRNDEIDNIEFELTGESLDEDEDEWEDDSEIDELKGDRRDDVTFTHELPFDVEDGEHSITITVSGDCANSSDICDDDIEFTLEVEKEKHELLISSAALDPQVLACEGSSSLAVSIYNIGREDEDEVILEVKNNDLGISFKEEFSLEICPDDDCSYAKTFNIESSDDQKAGTYPLSIKVTYDEGGKAETKTVNLDVEECVAEEEPVEILGCTDATALNYNSQATKDDGSCEYEEEEEEEVTEVPEAVPVTPITGGLLAAPFTVEKVAVISLIGLGVLLVVILVIFLVIRAAKKP